MLPNTQDFSCCAICHIPLKGRQQSFRKGSPPPRFRKRVPRAIIRVLDGGRPSSPVTRLPSRASPAWRRPALPSADVDVKLPPTSPGVSLSKDFCHFPLFKSRTRPAAGLVTSEFAATQTHTLDLVVFIASFSEWDRRTRGGVPHPMHAPWCVSCLLDSPLLLPRSFLVLGGQGRRREGDSPRGRAPRLQAFLAPHPPPPAPPPTLHL